jgi:hypothetical protein
MAFYPPQPDFAALIHRCCDTGGDKEFKEFRSAWHPYMEAGLALVDVDWNATGKLYESIYGEYREIFREPFNPGLDYETYLLAVAYSHLIEERGEQLLRQLLAQTLLKLVKAMTPHEVNIVVFCAILRTPGSCVSQILRAAFPPRSGQALVRKLFGPRPRERPQAPSACLQSLERLLAPLC